MKVISYNVNGIRAAMRKNLTGWIKVVDPDVLCLQEIKATEDQIDLVDLESLGYHHIWNPASKKGYSGVGILSRYPIRQVLYGIGNEEFDHEGRVLSAVVNGIRIISAYFPSGASKPERQIYKLRFLEAFSRHLEGISREPSIITGDFNICHTAIDIHNPIRLAGVPGFTPAESAWITSLIDTGFKDSFRLFNSEGGHYSWWSYMAKAREKNLGWRIDYAFVSDRLAENVTRSGILKEARHSDHAPIFVELDI